MTANTLRFNNSLFETGIDDETTNIIWTFCEPSYSGINNEDDLYALDYVIDIIEINKRSVDPATESELMTRIDNALAQLKKLEKALDYVAVPKFWQE